MSDKMIFKIFIAVLLFLSPLVIHMYETVAYYIVVILGIAYGVLSEVFKWDKKLDERFYKRWGKARESGYWINVVCEGLRGLPLMLFILFLSHFISYGGTPIEIIAKLSQKPSVILLGVVLIFSFIIGLTKFHENEKRFHRIDWEIRNDL